MFKAILLAGLSLLDHQSVRAEQSSCRTSDCVTPVHFTSVSERRGYGLLIAAPFSGCGRVRFRVEGDGAAFLGHTPPLGPGELAVVRIGRGFSPGEHVLTVAARGCAPAPAATRRVTLAKRSPDHGWRASD